VEGICFSGFFAINSNKLQNLGLERKITCTFNMFTLLIFLYKINYENVEKTKCVHAWAIGTSYIGIFDFHKQKRKTKQKD
jgi:hypothetical protein